MAQKKSKFFPIIIILGLIILVGIFFIFRHFENRMLGMVSEGFNCHDIEGASNTNTSFQTEDDPLCAVVAAGGGPEEVHVRLEAGSQPSLECIGGESDPETVKVLLAMGANWKIVAPGGGVVFERLAKDNGPQAEPIRRIIRTEQFIAQCAEGSLEEVEEATGQGMNVNRPNSFQTPLMATATATDEGLGVAKAKVLLAAGADPSGRNGQGMTPLQIAASRDNVEMVQLLLKAGADVNAVDNVGRTALWEALHQGRRKCGEGITNKEKDCPALKLQEQVIELLRGAGATSQPTPEALQVL